MALPVILLALLTGCAVQTGPMRPSDRQRIIISPNVDAIESRVMRDLRNNPAMHVSSYALSDCDTSDSWLPEKGPIKDIQFWRALHHESQLKHMCADKHAALIEQFKAALGVIRERQ